MRFKVRREAGEHEIFAKNAFDSQIGKTVPVNFRETDDSPVIASVGQARLVSATVIEDGKAVDLVLESLFEDGEIPNAAGKMPGAYSSMSFSFRPPFNIR